MSETYEATSCLFYKEFDDTLSLVSAIPNLPLPFHSDSQHFKSLRRGGLRAFWTLKQKTGCFFHKKGSRPGGELPRFVPNKPMC